MFNIGMLKKNFHNYATNDLDIIRKGSSKYSQFNQTKTVNINVLLNKIKIDEKKKIKQKYILFIAGSALVSITALLVF